MKKLITIAAAGLLAFGTASAQSDNAASMTELLRLIEQGQARDSQEARQREAEFTTQRNQQQALLPRRFRLFLVVLNHGVCACGSVTSNTTPLSVLCASILPP